MKILIVSTYDKLGGASVAALRLHKALLDIRVDSQMIVQNKISDDYTILAKKNKISRGLNKMRPTIDNLPVNFYKNRKQTLFSPSWFPFSGIADLINEVNPDLVHLHWISGGMLRIEDINKIKAPIVWTLHDCWPFTGGCHILFDCSKYRKSCGSCPTLGSNDENDLSKKIFNRKKRVYNAQKKLTIVAVSKWIFEASKSSTLLKNKRHVIIPNPIDINIFKPLRKDIARDLWNLPNGKKLILFGAYNAINDLNKGFQELSNALKNLKSTEVELVVFGSSQPETQTNFEFQTHFLGHLHDEISLAALYSAVDVMVVPSHQEAFGQTASESLACGTPVVAFGSSGLLDIVDHKINGYLAEPFKSIDLAFGIDWVLNNPLYDELRLNARKKVLRDFDSKKIASKFFTLYNDIIG
jgi:glycosyltransferase involved in cell wall biosynthesis